MNSQLGRSFIVVACVCLVTGLSAGAAAQGLSDMRGTVVDTSGGALPGVSIVITNQASGTFREVTSNGDVERHHWSLCDPPQTGKDLAEPIGR